MDRDDLTDLDPEAATFIRLLHRRGYSSHEIATLLVLAGYPAPNRTTH